MEFLNVLQAMMLLGLALMTKLIQDNDKIAKQSRDELQKKIDKLTELISEFLSDD